MNVIFCEDNEDQSRRYSAMIRRCAERAGVTLELCVFSSGDKLIFHMENQFAGVDLVYMDIHMTGNDGMKTAHTLRRLGYIGDIIFLTVDRELVFDAFDVEAMHYLLKGNLDDRQFFTVFSRAAKRSKQRRQEYACFSCAGETINVALDDILYFSLENRIISLYYEKDGVESVFEFYSTLEKLENTFFNKGFARSSRNQLVSGRRIRKVLRDRIVLSNGFIMPLSTRRAVRLKQLFAEYSLPN